MTVEKIEWEEERKRGKDAEKRYTVIRRVIRQIDSMPEFLVEFINVSAVKELIIVIAVRSLL